MATSGSVIYSCCLMEPDLSEQSLCQEQESLKYFKLLTFLKRASRGQMALFTKGTGRISKLFLPSCLTQEPRECSLTTGPNE